MQRQDSRAKVDNKAEIEQQGMTAQPLHILLVTETWLPDVNGVSLSLMQLVSGMVAQGHRVSLLRPAPKHQAKGIDADHPDTIIASNPMLASSPISPISPISHDIQVRGVSIPRYPDMQFGLPVYARIKHSIRQLRPDIVHIATEGPLGLAVLLASKRCGVAVTTGYHTQFHDFSRHFGFGLLARPLMAYFRYFHNYSDATCVPSLKTKNDLDALKFKRLYHVGRGVDSQRFHPDKRSRSLRQHWGVGQQDTVVLMVSRLSPEKGVDVVMAAYKQLQIQQLHRSLKLVIVGDGPDRSRLETMATGNEDIVFTGAKLGDELAAHYASADVFVFASQVETFGNVVTEAMASGLPVYAFDDAAAAMYVDEHCGGLVALGDVDGFITMVADMPKIQQLKEQGRQARSKVANMSWQQPVSDMLGMFTDAIAARCQPVQLSVSSQPATAFTDTPTVQEKTGLQNAVPLQEVKSLHHATYHATHHAALTAKQQIHSKLEQVSDSKQTEGIHLSRF